MSVSAVGASFIVALDDPANIYKRMSRDALSDALIKAIESDNSAEAIAILNSGCELSPYDLGKALWLAIEKKNDPLVKQLLTKPIRWDFFPEALTRAFIYSSPFANEIWEIIKRKGIKSDEMGNALCRAIQWDSPLAIELWKQGGIGPYSLGEVFRDTIERRHPLCDLIWDSGQAMHPTTLGDAFYQALVYNPVWAEKIFLSKRDINPNKLGESLAIAICRHFPLTRELWDSFKPGYNEYFRGPQHVTNALVAALEHDPPLAATLWSWITSRVRQKDFGMARILSTAIRFRSPLAKPIYEEHSRLSPQFTMSSRELVDVLVEAIKCDSPLTTVLITSELAMDPASLGEALVLCWTTNRLDVARLLMAHRKISPESVGEVFSAAMQSEGSFAQEILDSSQALPCKMVKELLKL